MDNNDLKSRMKKYENKYNMEIKPYNPFILKLTGVKFIKYMRIFIKPYDSVFVLSMIDTMNDLINYTGATTGYTQSNEISLIFPPMCKKNDNIISKHIKNGRVIKLCSVISSYCSVKFYFNLQKNLNKNIGVYSEHIVNMLNNTPVFFACRAIEFDESMINELINHQIWRLNDCTHNAIRLYGEYYYGKKTTLNIGTNNIIEKLKQDNITIPNFIMYGVYGKKQLYMQDNVQISTIINKVMNFQYSPELLQIFFSKYWSDIDSSIIEIYDICDEQIYNDKI
jgi:tRNA(His) guanylyltransferase